jgi:hypothetical protein
MSRPRARRLALLLSAATLAVVACDRGDSSARRDSAADSVATSPSSSDPAERWVSELGPMLVVPADTEGEGIVLFPTEPTEGLVSAKPLTLLTSAGDSSAAAAALVVSDSQVCGEAAMVRFRGPVVQPWSVGLLARSGATIPMDSIEGLPSADSAKFAADLARLASALPMPPGSRFGGLPFVVVRARRFDAAGRQMLVAHLMRRLPQEAAPLEEHFLVVGERPAPGERFVASYHTRSEGTEETADQFEIMSAIRGDSTTFLLFARDQAARTVYQILERDTSGVWRERWSRTLSC